MSEFSLSRREINRILREAQSSDLSSVKILQSRHPSSFHWSCLKYENTGDTILHCAARLGHIDTVRYLLLSYRPSGVDCTNNDNKTALHEAAQFGHADIVHLLLEKGAQVNALKRADWTPLMLACTRGDSETVRTLVDAGGWVNYGNKDGWTSLHLAARQGSESTWWCLMRKGGDCKARTKNGRSVLHVAALHGNVSIVRSLLEVGLDVDVTDNCGNTPLHEAVLGGHLEICRTLIEESKALVDCRNNVDFNLLHLASSEGYSDLVEFLVTELGFDVNDTTRNGFTALHCAARKRRRPVHQLLLELGCDSNIKDNYGRAASDYLQ